MGRIVRSVVLASFLLILIAFWTLNTELVTGRYVTGGVPPLPAVAVLLLLSSLSPLLRRIHPRLSLARADILLIYSFLVVAVPLLGAYMARAFLPHLTVLSYYASPENELGKLWAHFPKWMTVNDAEVIRKCYEGAHGEVPWRAWLQPLALWGLFFLVLFLTVMCFLILLRRQWTEHERLTYPLLFLPLRMTEGIGDESLGASFVAAFFKNPLMWLGFALAAWHDLANITRAFLPSFPATGFFYDLGQFFTERPLSSLQPLRFFFMPEAVGFGYFMSSEIAFSVCFFYFLNKAIAVLGTVMGYERPGFPYLQEQSAGGYLALGVVLLYRARRQIGLCLRKAFRGDLSIDDSREPLPYRVAVFGAIAGSLFVIGWMRAAGMSLLIAVPYVIILLLFTVVYARIRAETGAPFEFLYPYGLPKAMILNATGSSALIGVGGLDTLTAFSGFAWLSRHHFAEIMGAYQLDDFRLGETATPNRRAMAGVMTLALLVGLSCAFWCHLTAYYTHGQVMVEGGGGSADYRTRVALWEFQAAAQSVQSPVPPDWTKTTFTGAGFLVAPILVALRTALPGFPFHPLGYVIGTAYGSDTPFWGPFLTVWLVKSVILRWGGMRLYRQLIPVFLGLVVGHFFTAGMLWSTWSLFIPEMISKRYHLWFG